MKALTQDRYGTADVLEFRDIERPTPAQRTGPGPRRRGRDGPRRVALHVRRALPHADFSGSGSEPRASPCRGPTSPAWSRPSAPASASSSRVMRCTARPAAPSPSTRWQPIGKIAPKPPQLSFEQAAVLPYPTFVAMQALRDHGQVQPGQRVLVVGASGAVGTVAVQLAVAFGAAVTGVCSGEHADLVRSLGADDVIDYRTQDLGDGSRQFDLILDIGGRTSVARLRRALTRTGTLVILGGEGDRWIGGTQRQLWAGVLSQFVPQKLGAFVVKENSGELLTMNELVATGKVAPILGRTFPLADGAAAVAAFEKGDTKGRIVITP